MKVKFKMTSDGEVAIVPRAEYDLLWIWRVKPRKTSEPHASLPAKREIAGGAPVLPKAVVDRLGNGENPIRVLRQFRERTQDELATAVGITQNYLSDLETGKRKGPLALHRKFAQALGVPLELLSAIAVREIRPGKVSKRRQVIADMKRSRGQR